jgi:hypothetical protein
MTPQESIERRMAALFVLALVLIAWQAPKTRPLLPPPYVSVLETGEQVFPVAVPPDAPPSIPTDPTERLAFLKEHAVDGFEAFPDGSCEVFVRMSAHHWLRFPLARTDRTERTDLYATGTGWLARGGVPTLSGSGPGAETEVFCPP